jgi:hypothetical protein
MTRAFLFASLVLVAGCPGSSSTDTGTGSDVPVLDAPTTTDAPGLDAPAADTPGLDAPSTPDTPGGPVCEGGMTGSCTGGLSCECCPAGGPTMNCLCSTPCTTDAQCTDPSRPTCQHPPDGPGFCAPSSFTCCWLCL